MSYQTEEELEDAELGHNWDEDWLDEYSDDEYSDDYWEDDDE